MRFVTIAAMLFVFHAVSFAEPETVIVPYDATKPVAGQRPDQFYVPYDRFIELWEAAKATRRGPKPEASRIAWALNSARYEGTLKEGVAGFRGTIELNTFRDEWVAVPLEFGRVKIGSLKLDGQPASFDGDKVLIEKPGRHVIEVVFDVPFDKGATTVAWNIPRTAATLTSIALPQTQMRATISPGSGVVEKIVNGQKIVTAAMGETAEVRLAIDPSIAMSQMKTPALATVTTQLTATPAVETTRTRFDFAFPDALQDRFTVSMDKGATLVNLDAPNVKSWKLVAGPDAQVLDVVLTEPAKDNYRLNIECERNVPPLPAELSAPNFSAVAARVEHVAGLFAGADIELDARPPMGFRQIVWRGENPQRARLVAAFSWTVATIDGGALSYKIRRVETKREADVSYVYQVNRQKIELIASFDLQAKGSELFDATLALPADFEVQAVQSARLKDWWRDGNSLRIRFKGATPRLTPLVVYLVRQYNAAPDKLELAPLAIDGFKQVRGEAIIAAHKGVKATLDLSSDAKEVAPENAAKDFAILPPMERKRAFVFKQQNFHGSVRLESLPARMNALWVMHAQAHEGWVALSTHARLNVRQGSATKVSFSLPASLPEARVTGSEVRETASKLAGDRRIYEVLFQNEVYAAAEFTIDVEQSVAAEAAMPAIEFEGADRVDGFLLVENASEYEMRLAPRGLDTAQRSDIPFLPNLSASASVFRAQPGWSLVLTMNRLEKAASRSAFVAWAEITTAIRANGAEWNRATYHLQNRSLQFLPVKLPRGSELVSVRVAGQNVRADAGEVEKQSVVLVPLIKTKPGDLSYDVEVIYRSTDRRALGWMSRRSLDDPDLIGVTIEKTLWNLWLPDNFPLANGSEKVGNMEMVIEEIARTEKLEGALDELKSLSSVISATRSVSVRKAAESNYRQLAKTLEESAKTPADERQYFYKENVGKKAASQQQSEVLVRNRGIQDKLKDVQKNLAEMKPSEAAPELEQAVRAAAPKAGKWGLNKGYDAKAQPATTPMPAVPAKGAEQLFINDFVVQNKTRQETGEEDKQGLLFDRMPDVVKAKSDELKKSQVDELGGARKAAAPALPEKPATGSAGESSVVLGTARSNSVVVANQPQQVDAASRQKTELAFESEMAGVDGGRLAINGDNSFSGGTSISAGVAGFALGAAPQAGASRVDAQSDRAANEPEQLRQTGRISLAVDFPTEGQVYHFKKVKANATLGLWIRSSQTFANWKRVVVFGALALALGLVGRWVDGRRFGWFAAKRI